MAIYNSKSRLLTAVCKNSSDSAIFSFIRVFHFGISPSLKIELSLSRQILGRLFSSGSMNRRKQAKLEWRNKDSTDGRDKQGKRQWRRKDFTDIAAGPNSEPSQKDSTDGRNIQCKLEWRRKDSTDGRGIAAGSNSEPSPKTNLKRRHRKDKQNKSAKAQPCSSTKSPVDSSKSGSLKVKPFDICFKNPRRLGDNSHDNIGGVEFLADTTQTVDGVTATQPILRRGMVLLKNYLTNQEQLEIVKTCRELGRCPEGFYQPRYSNGARLRLQMMCLGLNWDPITRNYEDRRPFDGLKPPDIPDKFDLLVKRAIEDAHEIIKKDMAVDDPEEILPSMAPNICIVNFYTSTGRLGLHQDRDESKESLDKGLPVVSLSVGDSAEFMYGDQRDVEKAEKLVLESGDVLIFGGESRMVFHGVSSIIPDTSPEYLLHEDYRLRPGRLNLTFRQL